MKNKLRTKQGRYTAYALHCGYVSQLNGRHLMVEHNQYVVKSYLDENKYFNTLKEARKYQLR